MTTHLCRDFLAKPTTTYIPANVSLYFAAIFFRHVIGFTQVGHTNFNINSGSMTLASGATATLNPAAGLNAYVTIPSGTYAVSITDVDRILALKSSANPMLNSGLFRVSAIDTSSNSLICSLRAQSAFVSETNVSWALCEHESTAISGFTNATNALAAGSYRGWGSSTCSRLILQSPHSSSWQVRLNYETTYDASESSATLTIAQATIAPGFSGSSVGDYTPGGPHLHTPLWWNALNSRTAYTVPGLYYTNDAIAEGFIRFSAWGDDSTGTCLFIVRSANTTYPYDTMLAVGFPEDEEFVSTDALFRIFSYGNNLNFQRKTNSAVSFNQGLAYNAGNHSTFGAAYGLSRQPVACAVASYSYLLSQSISAGVFDDSLASDSAFINGLELEPVDLIAGTYDVTNTAATQGLLLEPRRMGRLPFARAGRKNYPQWTTTVDNLWLHTTNGVFLPWSGSIAP